MEKVGGTHLNKHREHIRRVRGRKITEHRGREMKGRKTGRNRVKERDEAEQ